MFVFWRRGIGWYGYLLDMSIIVMNLKNWMMLAAVWWASGVACRGALDGAVPVCYLIRCLKRRKVPKVKCLKLEDIHHNDDIYSIKERITWEAKTRFDLVAFIMHMLHQRK